MESIDVERPPLDPAVEYPQEYLNKYGLDDQMTYKRARGRLLTDEGRRKTREAGGNDVGMEDVAPLRQFGPIPLPEMRPTAIQMYQRPIGPALPANIIANRYLQRQEMRVGRGSLHLAGDKKDLIVGYKANSLCTTLVEDALERAFLAIKLLDPEHADIIRSRLAKAGIKNGNASHAGSKEITFKKAVSIALQAEKWVYEAQAAAAKSMVKQSKHCLHNLAGRRKRTKEEKEAAYEKRYGLPRGTKAERTARKRAKAQQ